MAKKNSDYAFYLKVDMSKFKEGKWIAIADKSVIATANGADIAHKKAKKIKPEGEILIVRVPPRNLVIY